MSFIHCRKCDWGQDDFETEDYAPTGPMIWRTREEYLKENCAGICPQCGQQALTED